ncbi:ionotropic receptor 75a-like isoform X2 [Vespula pensylvanica]|uniref:ionotropic receptor 75a-like isoform X2 n=1 Tax=Vespula pensylvanica TaxID=30213 RepID=UPI001CBA0808|nr:ionotropic receptor 75a-like isoform X2 [Vespula pensylvanica]
MISGLIAISIIAILCTTKATNIAVTFTKEYFSEKYIQYLVVFGCWNSFDKMNFFRRDLLNNLTISYVPIKDNIEINTILKVNYYKLGIILDIDCPQSEIILEQFDENRLSYNESFFWLMITESNAVPIDFLRDLPLSIASEITVALRQKDVYVLYDVYNFSHRHGGRLNVTYMGYWSSDDGLRNELTQYKMNLIRGTTWGYLVNGTWNGILADMIRGTVDISATPYLFKPERFDACDYTVQTYIAKTAIIFRHPKTSDIHNVFLMPFTEDVWYLILIVAIIYWLTLLLTVKIELYFDNYPKMCTLDTNPTSETALITAAAICQQGLSDGPRIYSGRIVFLSLFLWGLLLIQFYSASVVGSLLSEPPRFIHTLKNLSDSSLEVGIEDMAYNYDYLAKSTNPAVHELNRKKIQSSKKRGVEPFLTAEEGLKKVKRGGYAFHVDIATAYKIIEDTFSQDEICDLEEIQLFPVERIATAIRKHSPFKKMVTYGLRKMMEHGMGGHLSYIWQPARPQCPEGHNEIPAPVALNEFSPALFSLFMGIAVALFVMLIEMYIEHRKRRRQRTLLEPLEVFSNSGISDLEQFDFHKIEPND